MNVIKFANTAGDSLCKLNLDDCFSTNMAQFRIKESSNEPSKVINWVKLLLKFVDNSRKRE